MQKFDRPALIMLCDIDPACRKWEAEQEFDAFVSLIANVVAGALLVGELVQGYATPEDLVNDLSTNSEEMAAAYQQEEEVLTQELEGDEVPSGANNDQTVKIDEGKYDYFFGRATGSQHNLDRTNQNALQMKRLGIPDDPGGFALLRDHLEQVAVDPTNVLRSFSTQYGNFVVKESLFVGPSGKFANFQSTWQIETDGTLKLTTIIPIGG